jgi:hypothetical protein
MLRPMLPVALAASLAALIAGGGALPPPGPSAVARVPEEPGVVVLPDDEPTLQAAAADLDADGAPEVVRLVGPDGGPLLAEVWRESTGSWTLAATPAVAVPGEGGQAEIAYVRRPVRLLVRQVDGRDRVTLLRQPEFADPDDPRECCLLLDDLVLADGELRLARVAEPGATADAVHVIDLDGDGTDELLATYSLDPLDDASTPTEARVYRWNGARFGPPTTTNLPVGSGSTAFVLGDSDDVPGDEAAFISRSAGGELFRVSLDPGDRLMAEGSGLFVDEAMAVPLNGRRRGLAVVGSGIGLTTISWPRGAEPSIATPTQIDGERLIGVVDIGGTPSLLAHLRDRNEVYALDLPDLAGETAVEIASSAASVALAGGPLRAYVGPLPGGGSDGRPSVIVGGRLVPAPRLSDPAAATGAFPGGRPIGLVGRDREWLAIQHGALPLPPLDPAGGPLDPPIVHPGAAVTIAPLVLAATPEGNGGDYEPVTSGGVPLPDGTVGVSRGGLIVAVLAPPGSRVYVSATETRGPIVPEVVGESGALDVAVPPGEATTEDPADATLTVATPAGHAYIGTWSMRILDDAPTITATPETPFGSGRVTIAGRTAPYATVEVAGVAVPVDEDGAFSTGVDLPPWPTEVTLVARDPIGHESRLVVSGVGLFDYRSLPWTPIALVVLAAIATALVLRVPKPRLAPRPAGDDAILEEMDEVDVR